MGLHFLKGDILHDGDVKASEPGILLFEPTRNGGLRLTGADFIVLKAEWEAKHRGEGPPSLNGQLFHLFDSPNRFRVGSVLHAARVGVEGESERDVHELESERLVRRVQSQSDRRTVSVEVEAR
jgi:hypothetical protein